MIKQKDKTDYKYYLNKNTKTELEVILIMYQIKYKKSYKKSVLIDLIIDNVNVITDFTLDIFQNDEFQNLKLLVKKEGIIKVKINYLLLDFLKNLKNNGLVFSEEDELFIMPEELVNSYKEKIKDKKVSNKIKRNTEEYNFILSYINVYGITTFDMFYENYKKDYNYTKEEAIKRIEVLSSFYKEISFFTNKEEKYIASIKFKSFKEASKFLTEGEYKLYTNEEIMNIYNFKFMAKNKQYKKLSRFIKKSYYVEKGSFKVINKYVLLPYLQETQINEEKADKKLFSLIDKYFQYNNEKHKEKFTELIKNIKPYYPSWKNKGYIEKE